MNILVLCGGKGTRLGLTDRPKPMVDVAGKPLLERLVEHGKACGFTRFVFLTGHLGEVIERHFGNGDKFGVSVGHVREPEALGTAGAVRAARDVLREPFVVLYGDVLIDVDLAHMVEYHYRAGALATLFVHPNDHPYDSDLVEVDDQGRILHFLSKPHPHDAVLPNLVSGAIYVLDPAAIDFVPCDGTPDWGRDVFPLMLAAGAHLQAYRSFEYAKDIGTPSRLAQALFDIQSGGVARRSRQRTKRAVFFDRDGVLNREIGGVHRPEQMELLPGAGAAVRQVNQSGIPAICVTNQPDLAKGMMSKEDLRRVSAALDTSLASDGAYLDALYYCPHHPERGWPGEVSELKIACECRKPKPGLLIAAARDFNLDLSESWMIGDRYADVAAARGAGARVVLVQTGQAGCDRDRHDCTPDLVAANVQEAVHLILQTVE